MAFKTLQMPGHSQTSCPMTLAKTTVPSGTQTRVQIKKLHPSFRSEPGPNDVWEVFEVTLGLCTKLAEDDALANLTRCL